MTGEAAEAPRFLDVGEAALVVEFGEQVDVALNDRVLALDAALAADRVAGVRECVPTYRSLLIAYDPLVLDRAALVAQVRARLASLPVQRGQGARWLLPCCYDTACGEDLALAASLLGMTPERLAAVQRGAEYRVFMYGFAPGFAYLGGLPAELALSRRSTPRPPYPAGAVMIGGGLCAVATVPMPTGWYVIGCTPERLFAPERPRPVFIEAGDTLRFEAVDLASFHALAARAAAGELVARRIDR
jgi:KipI family sensor histidine kinase inhibitor